MNTPKLHMGPESMLNSKYEFKLSKVARVHLVRNLGSSQVAPDIPGSSLVD